MLLIFDCDGVILDSMPIHVETEIEVYKKYGATLSFEETIRRFSGCSLAYSMGIIEKEQGVKFPANMAEILDEAKRKAFIERLKPIDGVREMLSALHNVPRCIASGTRTEPLKFILGHVGLYDRFAPNVFSADMVARGKPFPDLFLHAANQMGFAPQDCLVIEDGAAGVTAAKAAGMRVFGFVGGSHCLNDHADLLKAEGAELVFSSMAELPALLAKQKLLAA